MPDRRTANITAAALYGIAAIFLLLVIIGSTDRSSAVVRNIYFFRLDLSNIIPLSVHNAVLLNSVARSMGLHDFYQVGLWNFCEGYDDEGITFCSEPRRFFWFNPVEVLLSELLAGATISIPTQVTQILNLLKLAQHIMFGFFIAAIVLAAVLLAAATPLVPRSRLWSIPASIIAAAAALSVSAATILATVMSVGAQIALTSVDDLNISAEIGRPMFAFMWIATICINAAAIFHLAMACFCAPHKERAGSARGEPSPRCERRLQEQGMADSSAHGVPHSVADPESEGHAARLGQRPMLPDFLNMKRRKKGGASEAS